MFFLPIQLMKLTRLLDRSHLRQISLAMVASAAFVSLFTQAVSALESRSYVIDWFSQASYSQDGDCPGGVNLPTREQYAVNFTHLGYAPDEIEELMKQYALGNDGEWNVREMMRFRGRIDGKPVNAFVHPWTAIDPKLTTVDGAYAFGFNLDDHVGTNSFQDPLNKEMGVDNELFRAMGCIEQFRGTYEFRPTFWEFIWNSMKESSPAWLMTIVGEDLTKGGPITIIFDRAMEHLIFSPGGEATADLTYRADPDLRSHHVFEGQIEDGVIFITNPGFLRLLQDSLSFTEFVLEKTQLRLQIMPDGRLDGFIGGYQPWRQFYFGIAQGGLGYEGMIVNDIVGIYYLLRHHADAYPNPETGQNESISATYHIEAVPAFVLADKEGEFVEYSEHPDISVR
jgi:hypothetical protein